jgi:hypothetical protein
MIGGVYREEWEMTKNTEHTDNIVKFPLTNLESASLSTLIQEYRRLDATDEHDDEASDKLCDVRDAIEERLDDAGFWKINETGRPVWNTDVVATLQDEGLSEEGFNYLNDIYWEALREYAEAVSTLYVPRDRNIKCKELAAKLEPYGIEVRRFAEEKHYGLFHEPGRTYRTDYDNTQREVLEAVDVYWRGRTGKIDYLMVGSDYLRCWDNQDTGADYILNAIRETCGELVEGEEAATLILAQKNTSTYWMAASVMQRRLMAMEEQYIEQCMKRKKAEVA